jgi:hypothetical protein
MTTTPVATWVRVALVALGVPNALAGLWAVLAPESWYDRFPGWDPRLVAADPPYNAHLATDAGAGLLASGVVLIGAAWLGDRRSVRFGIAAFLVFAVPHTLWHAGNESPGLTSAQDAQNVGTLAFSVLVAVVLLVVVSRGPTTEPEEAVDLPSEGARR